MTSAKKDLNIQKAHTQVFVPLCVWDAPSAGPLPPAVHKALCPPRTERLFQSRVSPEEIQASKRNVFKINVATTIPKLNGHPSCIKSFCSPFSIVSHPNHFFIHHTKCASQPVLRHLLTNFGASVGMNRHLVIPGDCSDFSIKGRGFEFTPHVTFLNHFVPSFFSMCTKPIGTGWPRPVVLNLPTGCDLLIRFLTLW